MPSFGRPFDLKTLLHYGLFTETMDQPEISVTQALNHIQSWLNAKEFDKVIQGCQEILEMEPDNKRALALLKQAETERFGAQVSVTPEPSPTAAPAAVSPVPTAASAAVPPTPAPTPPPTPTGVHIEAHHELFGKDRAGSSASTSEKRKLFLAMFIPAVVVVLVGGGVIWSLSGQARKDEIEVIVEEPSPTLSEFDLRNEERKTELESLVHILENYKTENGAYPSVSQVEDVILSEGALTEIPLDPRSGELDSEGQAFSYIYAVYDIEDQVNAEFILSALLEDSEGRGSAWTYGADILLHPDYRNLELENVHLLGESKSDEGPKVKVKRS